MPSSRKRAASTSQSPTDKTVDSVDTDGSKRPFPEVFHDLIMEATSANKGNGPHAFEWVDGGAAFVVNDKPSLREILWKYFNREIFCYFVPTVFLGMGSFCLTF
jgi:hypothetical protein